MSERLIFTELGVSRESLDLITSPEIREILSTQLEQIERRWEHLDQQAPDLTSNTRRTLILGSSLGFFAGALFGTLNPENMTYSIVSGTIWGTGLSLTFGAMMDGLANRMHNAQVKEFKIRIKDFAGIMNSQSRKGLPQDTASG